MVKQSTQLKLLRELSKWSDEEYISFLEAHIDDLGRIVDKALAENKQLVSQLERYNTIRSTDMMSCGDA